MTLRPRHTLPAALPLVLLMTGSGAAALIYEIVWLQLLELVIGASAVSLGVLLGVFMGGLCLGSFAAPRWFDLGRHPLRVFAALELGIAAMGALLLFGMPHVGVLYVAAGNHSMVRVVVATGCLLPATVMMGATLPAIARAVEASRAGVSWLGFLYAGNLAGGVIGCLAAGFYLLPRYDMAVTTYVAGALNAGVALIAIAIATRTPQGILDRSGAAPGDRPHGLAPVYVAMALSGLTALACEVVWTRLLSLTFGATVYAFSLILAVFLCGLGIGSAAGAWLTRRTIDPRTALGWCQMLLCAAMAWAAFLLMQSLPYWPIAASVQTSLWLTFQLDLFRGLLVVLPGAILWGASFPLGLAAVAARGGDPGRLVGGVYAANTVGAIAGSLGVSLILIGAIGSRHTQQVLIGLAAVSGTVLLAPAIGRAGIRRDVRTITAASLVVAAGGAGLLAWRVPDVPGVLTAYGRRSAESVGRSRIIYSGEGRNAFIAVSEDASGVRNYHAAGKVQASARIEDMRLQRMLGHLSHLMAARPTRVLVIGCGAGITAGAVSIAPDVEHLTIVDIEPLVPAVASSYFGASNYRVIANPKVAVRIDDGRHFLMTSDETFDVITTDVVDPWVKGVATLFTREFFEAARRHLAPGGVVTQFVQLYQSSTETVRSEIATFMDVFPNTVVWGNTNNEQGYDLVLLGQVEPIVIDIDALQARLDSPKYGEVARSLREIGFESATALLSTYAGTTADLAPWLTGAAINRDRNLRLQYLAGLGLNVDERGPIYLEILQHATFPAHLFTGTPASVQAVRDAITRTIRR